MKSQSPKGICGTAALGCPGQFCTAEGGCATSYSCASTMSLRALAAVALLSVAMATPAAHASWLGPVAVATSPDGKRAFVALADACQVAVVDTARGSVVARVATSAKPTGLVLDPHSGRLYVTCGHPTGVVDAIDTNIMQKVMTIPVGHTATGAILTPDGSRLFVCNRFNNDVSVLSLPDGKELARVKAVREPVGGAVTPDGKTVFVINLLPDEAADNDTSAAVVTAIDAAHLTTVGVRLPNGSSSARGICVSPDGKQAYVAHVLSRNALPATQLEARLDEYQRGVDPRRARRSSLARFFSTTSISARRTPGGSRARRTARCSASHTPARMRSRFSISRAYWQSSRSVRKACGRPPKCAPLRRRNPPAEWPPNGSLRLFRRRWTRPTTSVFWPVCGTEFRCPARGLAGWRSPPASFMCRCTSPTR